MNIQSLFQKTKASLLKAGVSQTALLFAVLLALLACEQPGGTLPGANDALNNNVTLKSLSVSTGTLRPRFSAETLNYTLTVREGLGAVTISAAPNNTKATLSGTGSIPLDTNGKTVSVTVSAENGNKKTYTIVISKVSQPSIDITSAEDFKKIGVDDDFPLIAAYTLTTDISLGADWAGIASGPGDVFSGTFNGNNNTITLAGLTVSANTVNNGQEVLAGLFCNVSGGEGARARVENLTVAATITASSNNTMLNAGIIAGYAKAADFKNITVEGTVNVENPGNRLFLGGIAGLSDGSTMDNCVNTATIYGKGGGAGGLYTKIGGITGMFQGGTAITNCHNTGNIDAETVGANSFAGGIAGGSYFDFSSEYRGKIEDCWSSGNITARGGSFWAFAGGIAGTITGASDEEPTSIVRCYATGTIYGTNAVWPYVGGIVGYNYYGALTSQSYFTGTVIADTENDYTGGVAGYNSQQFGHNSRIEDCWSSGTVQGYNNAGGIVGRNQVNTYLLRCYTTTAVSLAGTASGEDSTTSDRGIGGITGLNASAMPDAITACVALNTSITAPAGDNIHRIVGSNRADLGSNYARTGLTPETGGTYTEAKGAGAADGEDCDEKPPESFYTGIGWDFDTVWKMGADGYPVLQWQD